jgi:hypothetical protein
MNCVFCKNTNQRTYNFSDIKTEPFSYIEKFSQVTQNPSIDIDQKIDELENKISNLESEL